MCASGWLNPGQIPCTAPWHVASPIALVSFVALRFRRIRLLSVVIVAEFLAALLVNWSVPHYFAPVVGALLAMHVCFLRWLRTLRPYGRRAFAAVVCAIVSMFVLRTVERLDLLNLPSVGSTRAALEQKLDSIPGDHVILVRYAPAHVVQDEYVFNGPNIDQQRVIWARAMTSGQDEELKRYYSGRTFWLFEPDVSARPKRLEAGIVYGTNRGTGISAAGHGEETRSRRKPGLSWALEF